MPFTPSHALVALPFVRTPLVPAAIAIGAMTPDLPLFLRGTMLGYGFTHSYANLVWTAVIALLLFVIWRVVLRPAVSELSPAWLARRLPSDWSESAVPAARRAIGIVGSPWYPVLLAVSLLLGVASHILWDSFTHEGRWGVQALPVLGDPWGPLTGYKWVQYGSGVIGLAVIAGWALLRLRDAVPRAELTRTLPSGIRIAWWFSLPAILLTAWLVGMAVYGPFSTGFTPQHLAYRMLPPACAVWGALTLLICVLLAVLRRRHQRG